MGSGGGRGRAWDVDDPDSVDAIEGAGEAARNMGDSVAAPGRGAPLTI